MATIKDFLSRYRPRYLRSLVYMLQASEYNVGDYLSWFHKVGDFSAVEKRKRLVKTTKAMIVLALAWTLLAVYLVFAAWLFLLLPNFYDWLFAVVFVLALPYLLAYGITVPLLMLQVVVQKPVEQVMTGRAAKTLKKHKAIKIAIAGSFGKTSMREIVGTVLAEGKKLPEKWASGNREDFPGEKRNLPTTDVSTSREAPDSLGERSELRESQSLRENRVLQPEKTPRAADSSPSATLQTASWKVALPPQSYNTPLGISKFIKSLKGDEDVIVFELGEYYPGDVRKLCQLTQPDIGIVTGVNEAHLEKFKTLDRTAKTIFELADYLGDKPVYVNGESELAKKYASAKHVLYNRHSVGIWRVANTVSDLDGTSFILGDGKTNIEVHSELLGLHQVGPLAAAAHLAMRLGLSPSQIEAGLAKTKPFDHRFEKITDANGVITLDDSYNGNPDGVAAVIQFLASLKNHRRFYVTPGLVEMGSRTKAVHEEIGKELAEAGIEKVILIKNSVTPHIAAGLKENHYQGEITWFDDAFAAFAALPLMTVRDDVVLLQNDWPDQYR
jgi:UDP-N-acetylmuramyl pentapeptide synthase